MSLILSVRADDWDEFINLDRVWDGQKTITNQEFEKVIDKLEENKKQKEDKQVKKKRKKLFGEGSTLHEELNPDSDIPELNLLKENKDGVLINLPVQIVINGETLEKGFYKVFPEKDNNSNKLYVTFYQSQFCKGKLEVFETNDDYGEENIDFAKIIPYNELFVKIIFGSIDFNAYALVPFLQE